MTHPGDGSGTNGHGTDGHAPDGHAPDGHATDGYATDEAAAAGMSEAELAEVRRHSPRRAARLESMRAGGVGAVGGSQLFDQDAPEHPVEQPGWHDHPDAPDHPDAYGQDVHPDAAYGHEVHPDDVHPDEAYAHPGAHPDDADWDHRSVPPDDSYLHEEPHAFGDPVADGYVAPVSYVPPRRRRRRGAGILALVVLTAIVGAAGWFAWQGLKPVVGDLMAFELFDSPDDYAGPGEGSVEVVVSPGDTGADMGRTLEDAGVVASVEAFVAAANAEPEFTSVQPGRYTLAQQIPATDAVASLLDPANRVNDTVVIAEGLRVGQILDRLAEGTGLPREDLQAALDAAELPLGVRETEGLINPAEGLLYPDGYQFGENPTAEGVIQAMLDRGQQVLDELGVPQEERLEVLTKASLVQGEARIDEDFGRVAQVVENRLAIDQPLGLDSTVNYATQTFDTRTTAEQRDSDSPYNTYRFPGLPPGPIKSPGRQAIEAVASPTPGPWLYFVTVDLCTGETAFAETFEEHQDNVAVLNAWQRENTNEDGTLDCG